MNPIKTIIPAQGKVMLKTIARFFGSGQPQKNASRNRVRLSVESLESRDVPTTFTVTDPRDLALA